MCIPDNIVIITMGERQRYDKGKVSESAALLVFVHSSFSKEASTALETFNCEKDCPIFLITRSPPMIGEFRR